MVRHGVRARARRRSVMPTSSGILPSEVHRRPRGVPMALPQPVERLWDELQSARAELLREAEGLSQREADWKPSERDWSVGEIIDHLTLAEINTGKLTTKLMKERPAGAARVPHDLAE